MESVLLPKKNLCAFVKSLTKFGELHGPVKRGTNSYAFDKINDVKKIALHYNRTILPPKKYFYAPIETMFKFSSKQGYDLVAPELEKKLVLFGVHPCDIHGIEILDIVFSGKYVDNYYFTRRKNIAIIGLSCTPDELCFCRSTGTDYIEHGFDLFLSEIEDAYIVWVGTSLGDDMVIAASSLFEEVTRKDEEEYIKRRNERINMFTRKVEIVDLPEILDFEYESTIWDELGNRCLSCGSCSMVCPTCYCYDIYDELNLDAKTGGRKRSWDSCLFKEHALVAGGHNFREARGLRYKNRFYHKHHGFMGEYGKTSCVGCGRCTQSCPADIDIVEMIKLIRGEKNA